LFDKIAAIVATGVNHDGRREILRFGLHSTPNRLDIFGLGVNRFGVLPDMIPR
jgi:hypothetical protein